MGSSQKVVVPYRERERVAPYVAALKTVGLQPLACCVDDIRDMGDAGALLLMGGTDVDPKLYGETAHTKTNAPDRPRDNAELSLLTEALAWDLPVLAICRGLQLLNVHQGGTLLQHIESGRHSPPVVDRAAPVHEVEVEQGTLLARVLGSTSARVNSRHHQAIGKIAPSLRVCATDQQDQLIEAAVLPGKRFVLGVQWHPEDQMAETHARRLFEEFARAVTAT